MTLSASARLAVIPELVQLQLLSKVGCITSVVTTAVGSAVGVLATGHGCMRLPAAKCHQQNATMLDSRIRAWSVVHQQPATWSMSPGVAVDIVKVHLLGL